MNPGTNQRMLPSATDLRPSLYDDPMVEKDPWRASAAVKLYERRRDNEALCIDHLVRFLKDRGYREQVLRLAPGTGRHKSGYRMDAFWLPDGTRYFFEHIFRGAWADPFLLTLICGELMLVRHRATIQEVG